MGTLGGSGYIALGIIVAFVVVLLGMTMKCLAAIAIGKRRLETETLSLANAERVWPSVKEGELFVTPLPAEMLRTETKDEKGVSLAVGRAQRVERLRTTPLAADAESLLAAVQEEGNLELPSYVRTIQSALVLIALLGTIIGLFYVLHSLPSLSGTPNMGDFDQVLSGLPYALVVTGVGILASLLVTFNLGGYDRAEQAFLRRLDAWTLDAVAPRILISPQAQMLAAFMDLGSKLSGSVRTLETTAQTVAKSVLDAKTAMDANMLAWQKSLEKTTEEFQEAANDYSSEVISASQNLSEAARSASTAIAGVGDTLGVAATSAQATAELVEKSGIHFAEVLTSLGEKTTLIPASIDRLTAATESATGAVTQTHAFQEYVHNEVRQTAQLMLDAVTKMDALRSLLNENIAAGTRRLDARESEVREVELRTAETVRQLMAALGSQATTLDEQTRRMGDAFAPRAEASGTGNRAEWKALTEATTQIAQIAARTETMFTEMERAAQRLPARPDSLSRPSSPSSSSGPDLSKVVQALESVTRSLEALRGDMGRPYSPRSAPAISEPRSNGNTPTTSLPTPSANPPALTTATPEWERFSSQTEHQAEQLATLIDLLREQNAPAQKRRQQMNALKQRLNHTLGGLWKKKERDEP